MMRVNAAVGRHYRLLTPVAWPMQMREKKAEPDADAENKE
jgi:hypothetical protein